MGYKCTDVSLILTRERYYKGMNIGPHQQNNVPLVTTAQAWYTPRLTKVTPVRIDEYDGP